MVTSLAGWRPGAVRYKWSLNCCICCCLLQASLTLLRQQSLLVLFVMADYDFRPGGSLKLKGGVADGGIVKRCVSFVLIIQCTSQISRKKKSKSKSNPQSDSAKDRERERVKELLFKEDAELAIGSASGSNRDSPAIPGNNNDRKTDAERRFEEAQRRRVSIPIEIKLFEKILTPKFSLLIK